MKSLTRSRAAAISMLALVLSIGVAAGCGGDGDSGGPQDAFMGLWFAEDPTNTGFTMTCTDTEFAPLFPTGMNQFRIFGSMSFEHGELTDLAETSGNCNLLNYNISGNNATVANPDPYLDDTAGCLVQFSVSDSTGYPLRAFIIVTPDPSWTVKLLPEKTTNGADRLQLVGTASAEILVEDGSATGVVSEPPCTYAGMDTFFRLTRP